MKQLFLVRHAQARGAAPGQDDRDRTLTEGGLHDARQLGRRLAALDAPPELVLSSPAARALSTARCIAEALGPSCGAVEVVEALHDALTGKVLDIVRSLDDDRAARVAVVAHNPAIGDLARALSASIGGFPPGAVAALRIDTDHWRDVGTARVVDAWQETPGDGRRNA